MPLLKAYFAVSKLRFKYEGKTRINVHELSISKWMKGALKKISQNSSMRCNSDFKK